MVEYSSDRRSNQMGQTEDAYGGARVRGGRQGAAGIEGVGVETVDAALSGLVSMLMGMDSEEVFRGIVGYL